MHSPRNLNRAGHLFFACLLCLLSLTACGQQRFEKMLDGMYAGTVPLIKPEALLALQDSSKVHLLDTRAPEEFAVSHLQGAKFVDYDAFDPAAVAHLPKDEPVVVYCSVGYRSERIGEKLQEMGFSQVFNLYGGIFYWKNKDHAVMNEHNVETDSVHTYNRLWGRWLEKGVKVYD